jgi:ankyrin repeat protein
MLIFAANEGFLDVVEFLLSIGADPNECSNVIYLMNNLQIFRMESLPCIEHASLID